MTPNKPVIAEEARKLLTGDNSKLENAMLDMVSRLADVVTYNAEAMNKLVHRVDELEKLVVQQSVPKKDQKVGECLEVLLKQGASKVRCIKVESNTYIVNKVYVVEQRAEDGTKFVRNENGIACGMSASLFVEVMPQKEPFELTFNRPSVYSTPLGVSFKDSAKQLFAEQLCHSQFLAVTRMFMGLPTVQLIHPRSL